VREKEKYKMEIVALFLILIGGGLNTYERLRWGFVHDYWNFLGLGIYNNFNDWLIGIGLLLYIINVWKKKKLK
jgi:lipoprotein signal peptidase